MGSAPDHILVKAAGRARCARGAESRFVRGQYQDWANSLAGAVRLVCTVGVHQYSVFIVVVRRLGQCTCRGNEIGVRCEKMRYLLCEDKPAQMLENKPAQMLCWIHGQ